MNSGDIVGLVAVIAIFLIPSIGLTARFALKPIVESVLRLRDALDRERVGSAVQDPRFTALQQEVVDLRETVDRLAETVHFDAQLRSGDAPAAARLSGSASASNA